MVESEIGRRPWIPFVVGVVAVALVLWLTVGENSSPEGPLAAVDRSKQSGGTNDDSTSDSGVPSLRIAAGGRLTLAEKDLPVDRPLALSLELSDEARGNGPRTARVVSVEAGRLDAEAISLPGSGTGLRLEISRKFLSRGLYMIEVDTDAQHPLRLQRYVLEVQ